MESVEIFFLVMRGSDAGRVPLPEGAIILLIANQGTHAALDTCIINNTWQIAGGVKEQTSIFYLQNEKNDCTDWNIEWVAGAITMEVLFIYKMYKN